METTVEIAPPVSQPGFFKRNLLPVLVAAAGGVLGVLGAIFQEGTQGIPSAILGPFIAGPIIEEAVKPIGVYILLARAPQLLRSRLYTAFLSALGGLSFAIVENLVYLNFYFPNHTQAMVIARFAMALPLHMIASFIVGFGINQRLTDSVWGKVPFMSGNWKFFISGMVLHSAYNISTIFWGSGIK